MVLRIWGELIGQNTRRDLSRVSSGHKSPDQQCEASERILSGIRGSRHGHSHREPCPVEEAKLENSNSRLLEVEL